MHPFVWCMFVQFQLYNILPRCNCVFFSGCVWVSVSWKRMQWALNMDLCLANTCTTFAVAAKTAFQLKRIFKLQGCAQWAPPKIIWTESKRSKQTKKIHFMNQSAPMCKAKRGNQVNYKASLSLSFSSSFNWALPSLTSRSPTRVPPFADVPVFVWSLSPSSAVFFPGFSFVPPCSVTHTCMQFRLLRFFYAWNFTFICEMCVFVPVVDTMLKSARSLVSTISLFPGTIYLSRNGCHRICLDEFACNVKCTHSLRPSFHCSHLNHFQQKFWLALSLSIHANLLLRMRSILWTTLFSSVLRFSISTSFPLPLIAPLLVYRERERQVLISGPTSLLFAFRILLWTKPTLWMDATN